MSNGYPKTERQARFVAVAKDLAECFAERADAYDRDGTFPFENFRELHESGYLGLTIPEEFGGWGADPLEFALAQEHLGRGCGSTALAATMHLTLLGRQGESRLWPNEVYARLCRDVLENGALVNSANSEPDLGSPSRGALPSTTAVRTPAGWVVNGRKRWASLAPALSYVYSLVTVIDGDEPPRRGNILIPMSTAGVRVEETWDNLGMRATASHDIVFEDVTVPLESLLPSDASGIPGDGTGWWTFPVQAVYLGIATGARDAAVKFARERVPNGMTGPIAELQTIQHKVAEMELLFWQSRAVLYDTVERYLAHPERRDEMAWELAAVKYTVSNNAIKVTDLALRVVGSVGLGRTLPIERHFRDARTALGHPPMDDASLTLIGKAALGLSTTGHRATSPISSGIELVRAAAAETART